MSRMSILFSYSVKYAFVRHKDNPLQVNTPFLSIVESGKILNSVRFIIWGGAKRKSPYILLGGCGCG